jgi:hypothetical protein
MSNSASSRVDYLMNNAMDRVYYDLWKHVNEGYCTAEDVEVALWAGWGDGVAEGWREWILEGEE